MLKKYVILCLLGITALSAKTHHVSNVYDFRKALENSVNNHENDTIILEKGIYKTTLDGYGPFAYADPEESNLTIKAASGLSADDVILDGGHQDTVLEITFDRESKIFLKNLTIRNGKDHGVYSTRSTTIDHCKIHDNGSEENISGGLPNGGGIQIDRYGSLILTYSEVFRNFASSAGGIFISRGDNTIEHSRIHHNESAGHGGGISSQADNLHITYSEIYANTARTGGGGMSCGGLYHYIDHTRIHNNVLIHSGFLSGTARGAGIEGCPLLYMDKSMIDHNAIKEIGTDLMYANAVAGVYNAESITNSIIVDNEGGMAISSKNITLINNTIANNTLKNPIPGSPVHAAALSGHIMNNIFQNNFGGVFLMKNTFFYNNYYDPKKLGTDGSTDIYKKNNKEYPKDAIVDFGPDYQLKSTNATAINTGLNPKSDAFKELFDRLDGYNELLPYMEADYADDIRVAGGTIDMGAYEYAAPHADAGSDKRVQVNKPIKIEGKGTGGIVSYKWEKEGNIIATTASFVYTPDTIGVDTLTFTVENCEGMTSTDTMKVTVSEFPPFDVPPILYLLF